MVYAEWDKQKWETSAKKVRGIESISLSCEAKTETDATNGVTKCTGRTLEKMTVTFSTATATGGNPKDEIKELELLTGKSAPFYCGEEQIGDNDFILTAAKTSEAMLNVNGDILSAKFELSFIEDATAQELEGAKKPEAAKENEKKSKLAIYIQGENIAPKISIKQIYYTQYAEKRCNPRGFKSVFYV
jgi:hypothetical protein